MRHSASCKRTYQFICENLDQATNSPQCRAIRKHLEGCPECRTYLSSLKKTVQLYKLLPPPRVPRGVHRELFRQISCLTPAPHRHAGKGRSRSAAKR
jgi:predicted anti-sigma-YlaC factor YlaD